MGQGRENARIFLKEHHDIREKLESALRKKMEIPGPGGPANSAASSGTNGVSHNEKHVATAAAATAAKARPAGGR